MQAFKCFADCSRCYVNENKKNLNDFVMRNVNVSEARVIKKKRMFKKN